MTAAADFEMSDSPVYHAEPESTSVSAILSMILGLLGCCVGVTAVPGLLLAVLGIVNVSRSRGRVGGMGFAVAGLILSLLNLAVWIAALVAGMQGLNWMRDHAAAPTAQVLQLLEQGDYDGARAAMAPPADGVSDEALDAFVTAYTEQLGAVVSAPGSIGEMFEMYGAVINGMEPFSGRQNMVPLPLMFENGPALIVSQIDPNTMGQRGATDLISSRLYIVLPDGSVISIPEDTSITSVPNMTVVIDSDEEGAEEAAGDAGESAGDAVDAAQDAAQDGVDDAVGDEGP